MKNNKKSILKVSLILLTIFLFSSNMVNAASLPYSFHETKKSQKIASGIVHENIRKFTAQGWLNINVLRVDIKNEHTELKGIFNQNGVPYRDSVSNMVNNSGAVAGVNGDYFNYSPLPSAMGTLINDGKMISSPVESGYALPTFYLDQEDNGNFEYIDRYISLKNVNQDSVYLVNTLNKVTPDFNTPTMLNSDWGKKSVGNRFKKDLTELVVEDNIVKEVRVGLEPTDIPANGYVVAVRGERSEALKAYQVGDEIKLHISATPDLEKIKFAIGGGSFILKNGQPQITNIHSSGSHPRTGIGVNEENTELILVTVDGRIGKYRGLEQKQFGQLLKELGAHNGMNLDGGGSTTMAVKKSPEEKAVVANNPSGGSQRKVVNSVGVFTNAPKGELDHIEISCTEPTMFKNSSRVFSVKAYDGLKNVIQHNPEELKISVEGIEATIEGNTIYPTTEGKGKINIEYKDLKNSLDITVLGEMKNIYAINKNIKIGANQKYDIPQVFGQDINGSKARLYLSDLQITVPEDIGKIENGILITNDSPKNGYLTIKFNDIVENIRLESNIPNIGESGVTPPPSTQFTDALNAKQESSKVIKIFSNTLTLNDDQVNLMKNNINTANTAVSLNGFSGKFSEGLTSPTKINAGAGYAAQKIDSVYLVNLDSRKGTLRLSNSYQWTHIKDTILNRPEKNVILTSQKPLWGEWSFTDQEEADVLHAKLVELKNQGKNVFFVHGGYYNTNEMIDGVRYIGIDLRAEKSAAAINNISVINFYLNGDNVTFSRENIFK